MKTQGNASDDPLRVARIADIMPDFAACNPLTKGYLTGGRIGGVYAPHTAVQIE